MGNKVAPRTRDEVSGIIDQFVTVASSKYLDFNGNPSLGYPCGYLQSTLANVLMELPAAKREFYLGLLKGN